MDAGKYEIDVLRFLFCLWVVAGISWHLILDNGVFQILYKKIEDSA